MTNIQPFCLVTWYVHRTMKESEPGCEKTCYCLHIHTATLLILAYKYNKIGHVNSLNVLFFMSDNKLLVLGFIYSFFISR